MKDKIRIFIIDDDVDFCVLMKAYFLRKNCEVFIAHNSVAAFFHLKELQPDTIFVASAACQSPEKDIEKIKGFAPDAEVILDSYHLPGDR